MKLSELSFILFFALIASFHGGAASPAGTIPGGVAGVPVDDPEVVRLSQFALEKLNQERVGENQRTLVEIVKASTQVVSGTLTRLTLKISEGDSKKLCDVEIWEQPWLNKTEMTKSDCVESQDRRKRQGQDLSLSLFTDFVKKHNKVYEDDVEFQKRYRIFRANLHKIKLLRQHEKGTAQYGLTWFSDLTTKEFKKHLGLKVPDNVDPFPPAEIPDIKLPKDFDWRQYNVVTPVKDQQACGSCWAFSVTGNIEGQWALKKGKLLSLSEQELVDCDKLDDGCGGGYMTNAYKAIMKMGGLETEDDYPYDAENEKCKFNKTEIRAEISGAVNISQDETKMAQWLVKNGPISVALNANAMQFYFGGISHPAKFLCSPENLDHGVLIVGFGEHHSGLLNRTIPYWIIKNSWGKRWGERGYYRLYRGKGVCGINLMASSATVN